jgi:hypothetical protein
MTPHWPIVLGTLASFTVAGCAGLDITPISPADEAAAHAGVRPLKGYVVHAPMVVIEISRREVCPRDDKGKCTGPTEVACVAGTPFTLPDPTRPFLVDIRSGLGKAGVDVAIANGWQLGNLKDSSDNTAILGAIEKIAGTRLMPLSRDDPGGRSCPAGLYRLRGDGTGFEPLPFIPARVP